MKKKFTIETSEYDGTSRPYIGIVDPSSGRVARWGNWIGTPGDEGLLEIVGEEGSVIVAGRSGPSLRKSWQCFYFVNDDLTLQKMGKSDAIKAARARRKRALANPSDTYAALFSALGASTLQEAIARVKQLKSIEAAQTAEKPETPTA